MSATDACAEAWQVEPEDLLVIHNHESIVRKVYDSGPVITFEWFDTETNEVLSDDFLPDTMFWFWVAD